MLKCEKENASPRPPPKISFKENWMKDLDSEFAGSSGEPSTNPTQIKNPIVRTRRPVKSEQPSGSLTQEIEKSVLFGCESTNVRTERPVKSYVPVSVERKWTIQSICSQREEIDIDFRVCPGLPLAVVKQAENFRVRELVKKIESHPHREAFQADLQQNFAYKPFSENAMIRERLQPVQ